MKNNYDFAIIGAGVFGAWTAHFLRKSGATVALLDGYGAANSRASSGGETRVVRMGYGPDELYTRWSMQSLPLWREFFTRTGRNMFVQSGVLWITNEQDKYVKQTIECLTKVEVDHEQLSALEVRERWPQLELDDTTIGVLEPYSGVLMARASVQAVVAELIKDGVEYFPMAAVPPKVKGKLASIETSAGIGVSASTFIFACGPWLPKIFPDLLKERIFPTRQEVFFLGPPAGSPDFGPSKMPVWLHRSHVNIPYALPDIEGRGFKIAFDRHGPEIDPDTEQRLVSNESTNELREYLRRHVPLLHDAPLLETRVCQYENTSNGDFLIDRHPEMENVWLAGGGSGHGFKHGPAFGNYLSGRILQNTQAEARFSLASKMTVQQRAVY